MLLSVVVPTFNNAEILPLCLRRILDQTLPKEAYEIVLVDDASTDGTAEIVAKAPQDYPGSRIQCFSNKNNMGPASARNVGIAAARSNLVVFIQDDILVKPDFLQRHVQFHQSFVEKEAALIGLVAFDETLRITPFMKWLENGHQFDYGRLVGEGKTKRSADSDRVAIEIIDKPYLTFYTPNLSVKRQFLLENDGFDENLFVPGGAVFEDTELGYRLSQQGLRLFFDRNILVSHRHQKTLASTCALRFVSGQVARRLYARHPELQDVFRDNFKTGLSRWVLNEATIRPLESIARFCEERLNAGLFFWLVCRYYYNEGYRLKSKPQRR